MMTLRNPPVGTECRECGNPSGAHNLGCKIGHLEAIAKVEELLRENEYLRDYGNKDCTAMAYAAMARDASEQKETTNA